MFCKSCGNQIDNDSIFCSFCGTKQSDIYKPSINEANSLGQTVPKTVNVNLSFGRQVIPKLKAENTQEPIPKYDIKYAKESEATFVGVVLLAISLFILIGGPPKFDSVNSYNQFNIFSSVASLILRLIAINWVVNITKRQNRPTFGWGLLAFFLPSIALIIVGQLRKLYNENEQIIHEEIEIETLNTNIKLTKLSEPKFTIKDVIQSDTEQLINYLKEYPESTRSRNFPNIVPIYIFQELNTRGVEIDSEMQVKLEMFAVSYGFNSFNKTLIHYH